MESTHKLRTALFTFLITLSIGSYLFLQARSAQLERHRILRLVEEDTQTSVEVPNLLLMDKVAKVVRRLVPVISQI